MEEHPEFLSQNRDEIRMFNFGGVCREVESLAVLARQKGASGVIASLWEVAGVSTSNARMDKQRLASRRE
jgi:hypothetical protein